MMSKILFSIILVCSVYGEIKLSWKERLNKKKDNKIENIYFQHFNNTFPTTYHLLSTHYKSSTKHLRHAKQMVGMGLREPVMKGNKLQAVFDKDMQIFLAKCLVFSAFEVVMLLVLWASCGCCCFRYCAIWYEKPGKVYSDESAVVTFG